MGEALEGWLVASKRLGPLPRMKGSALWAVAVAGRAVGRCRCRGRPLCQPATVLRRSVERLWLAILAGRVTLDHARVIEVPWRRG